MNPSIIYAIGWFLLSVSGTFTIVAIFRGKSPHLELAGPFLIAAGVAVYLSANNLSSNTESIFWIPVVIGFIFGSIAGYGAE